MADPAHVAEEFLDCWTTNDFERARTLLKDDLPGDDACIIYDLKTAPVPTARTAEWYRVSDGKISWVTVVFDARPFAALFEAQGN